MDCEQLLKYLSAYIDQELDDEVVLMAQKHLATCPNCRVVLDTTKKTISLYQRSVPRTISSECCQHLFEMLNVLFQRRKIAESHGEGTL